MRRAVVIGVVLAAACGPTAFVPPPPSPQRVYGASEVDERPEIVLTPPLHYPAGGSDGVVVVRVVVDSAGNPEPATALVVQGSDSVLVAAARTLVLKTLFRPARVRGRVVQVLVEVPVEFSAASLSGMIPRAARHSRSCRSTWATASSSCCSGRRAAGRQRRSAASPGSRSP